MNENSRSKNMEKIPCTFLYSNKHVRKSGGKIIHYKSDHVRKRNLTMRGRTFTRDEALQVIIASIISPLLSHPLRHFQTMFALKVTNIGASAQLCSIYHCISFEKNEFEILVSLSCADPESFVRGVQLMRGSRVQIPL